MASIPSLMKTICLTLTMFACSCRAYQLIWGLIPELNRLCPKQEGQSVTGMPDECNVNSFIMCFNGQAIAINNCGPQERFNRQKHGCDFIEQVVLPQNCQGTTIPSKKACGQPGVTAVSFDNSCKFYWSCTTFGQEKMPCNPKSYFIESKEKCMFLTEGYVARISREELEACDAKDPYTAEELAQR